MGLKSRVFEKLNFFGNHFYIGTTITIKLFTILVGFKKTKQFQDNFFKQISSFSTVLLFCEFVFILNGSSDLKILLL